MKRDEQMVRISLPSDDSHRKKWQKENEVTAIREGGLVAIAFPFEENGTEGSEHMWVLVQRIRTTTIFGKLMNVPIKATTLKFKAEVICKADQVEDYEPPKKYEPKRSSTWV